MKISVLTVCFNSGKYLERAIRSVLNQNYDNVEHIIVDGGSTDNTISLLKSYPHLRWISEPDRGQSDAMNKAFRLSSGEIIVYLNADDSFEPDVFAGIADFFRDHPETDMLIGNLNVIRTDSISLISPTIHYSQLLQHYKFEWPYNPVSYFYRRKVQEAIGDFPQNENLSMDVYFLLRAYKKFKVRKLDLIFGNFFLTDECKTANSDTLVSCKRQVIRFCRKEDRIGLLNYFIQLQIFLLRKSVRSFKNKYLQESK